MCNISKKSTQNERRVANLSGRILWSEMMLISRYHEPTLTKPVLNSYQTPTRLQINRLLHVLYSTSGLRFLVQQNAGADLG